VRHARPEDLHRVPDLLEGLRSVPQLRERTPGSFYLRSKGFLHLHVDGDEVWADVKVPGPAFERVPATTAEDQRALLDLVVAHLEDG